MEEVNYIVAASIRNEIHKHLKYTVECNQVHAMPKIAFNINNKQFELTPEQYVLKVSVN